MGIAVGIDLGTTNSAIAVRRLNTSVLNNAEGEALTPSCVTILPDSEAAVVGRGAKDLLKQYPEHTVVSVKRFMGRRFSEPEVQKVVAEHRYHYGIEADPQRPEALLLRLGAKHLSPEALSAMILRKVTADGGIDAGDEVASAVVTVPAYFSDRQKFATRTACQQAGLSLLRLLPEPTAAAIAFGLEEMAPEDARTVMVFDLGGGTFDLSVLSIAGGQFMEVTKGGDMWLGGDDVDRMIAEHVYAVTERDTGCGSIVELIAKLDAATRARFIAELREACERAKIELSSEDQATIEVFGALRDGQGKLVDIDVTLTRAAFDLMLAPMTARLLAITDEILADIHFDEGLVDEVLMVGGSSLIPAVQQALRGKFGASKVRVHPRPMYAVVEGAALMAQRLAGRDKGSQDTELNLMHAVAHNYYLQLADGKRHLVVPRNAPLPFHGEERLVFKDETQEVARLRLFDEADGVLETVGELWFYRRRGDILTSIGDLSKKKQELVLGIEIDEDHIVKMRSWPAEAPASADEVTIARGGPATRLFADLEKTLSWIVQHLGPGHWNFVLLSKVIKETILRVMDAASGAIDLTEEDLAMRQIETLRHLALKECFPLRVLETLQHIVQHVLDGFTERDQAALSAALPDLALRLRQLTDAEAIIATVATVKRLIDRDAYGQELEEAAEIIAGPLAAKPSQARDLRSKAAALGRARRDGDKLGEERAAMDLQTELSHWTSDYTFDKDDFVRDVELLR